MTAECEGTEVTAAELAAMPIVTGKINAANIAPFAPISALTIKSPDGRDLFVFHRDGTVTGDVGDASEAARVLVTEVRRLMGGSVFAEREGADVEASEPLLISAARRMAQTHPHRHIRIVSGAGTTVGGFMAELDEWIAERERIAAERALREAADAALTMFDPPVSECIEWSEWLRARADKPGRMTLEVAAMAPTAVGPHEFVGRSDRWCEVEGCDRPDRNPIHRQPGRDDAGGVS